MFLFRHEDGIPTPSWSMRSANPIDYGCHDGVYHLDFRITQATRFIPEDDLKLYFMDGWLVYYNFLDSWVGVPLRVELADGSTRSHRSRLDENLRMVFS